MSFNNTKTPLKPTTKAKYPIPLVKGKNGVLTYIPDGYTLAKFMRYYADHTNREMMEIFGISFSTLQRLRRSAGLTKNMRTIRRKQAAMVKKKCEANGYYDSLRGHAPSQAAMDATKAMRANGWNPWDKVRENKRRYTQLRAKMAADRKLLMENERMRVNLGLPQRTNLHIPFAIYTKTQLSLRMNMRKRGYIVGDSMSDTERMNIYYNDTTRRSTIVERNATKAHFNILHAPRKQYALPTYS